MEPGILSPGPSEYSHCLKTGQVLFSGHWFKAKSEVWILECPKTRHISYDRKPEYRTAKLDLFINKDIFFINKTILVSLIWKLDIRPEYWSSFQVMTWKPDI